MAYGGQDTLPEWDGDYEDGDNENADETTPFIPNEASTPYQTRPREEIEMKTFQEKSGRPGTSQTETSFGGTQDIERRLQNLRENSETGIILDGTRVPEGFDISLLGEDFKNKYIERAENLKKKDFLSTLKNHCVSVSTKIHSNFM